MKKITFPIEIKEQIKKEIISELENRKVRLDSDSIDFVLGKAKELIEANKQRFDNQEIIASILKQAQLSDQEKQLAFNKEKIWTKEVRTDFIEDIIKILPTPKDGINGTDGEKGESGKDGNDYTLTDVDKLDIAQKVELTGLMKEDVFNQRLAQFLKDIQSGKIKLPAHGNSKITDVEIISLINKYLGGSNWQGPTNLQIAQITQSLSTGLISGMELSVNSGDASKFDISSGYGYCVDNTTTPIIPVVDYVEFTGLAAQTVTNIATKLVTYISIDCDGNIIQSDTIPAEEERRTNIYIGVLVHTNLSTIEAVNNTPTLAIDTDAQLQDLMGSLGLFNIEGNAIRSYNGSLEITKSSGSIFKVGGNFTNNNKIPHKIELLAQDPITSIQYRTQTGITYNPSGVLDPGYYDLAGTRTALSNTKKASNQRVYVFPSGSIRIQYGQTEYSNLSSAIEGLATETYIIESNLRQNGLLLCVISLRAGATDLSLSTDARFIPSGKWGDISNTGSLAVGTLQQIYANSTQPQIIPDATRGAFEVSDENDLGEAVARFGDKSAGNYTEFESDGTDVRKGSSTQWDDLVRSLAAQKLESTAGKVDYDWDENAVVFNSGGNIATSADRLIFSIEAPHAMLTDSSMHVHIHWEQTTTNNIQWTLQYRIQKNGAEKITTWTTVSADNTNNVYDYTAGTLNQITELAMIDLTDAGISATVQIRLARTDSTAGNILGTFVDAHIQRDMIGSRSEYVK